MHETLKKINAVFGIVNVIGSIAGAIFCWTEDLIGIGFLVLLGGLAYSFFIYVILGTIAETGENVASIKEETQKQSALAESIEKALSLQKDGAVSGIGHSGSTTQKNSAALQKKTDNRNENSQSEVRVNEDSNTVAPTIGPKPDTMICPRCKEVQRAGRLKCWNCGALFTTDEE